MVQGRERACAAYAQANPAFPPLEQTRCGKGVLEVMEARARAPIPLSARAGGVRGDGSEWGWGTDRVLKEPLGWVFSSFR